MLQTVADLIYTARCNKTSQLCHVGIGSVNSALVSTVNHLLLLLVLKANDRDLCFCDALELSIYLWMLGRKDDAWSVSCHVCGFVHRSQ